MAPRHVDRAEKAGSIARTALVLFSEKGYRATSVGQIAREAGIGKGTVYDYFETKEDIFIAAVMEWLGQFEDNLMVRLEGLEDPIERLYAVARMHKELYGSIDSNTMHLFLQILQQSMMPGGIIAKRRHLVQEMAATATRTMANVLLEGVARGVFRWVNGDTFTDADIGDLAFVEDDQTVQKAAAASADIIAGVVLDVDSSGVWVDTYDIGAQGASAPSSLAVSGNATVGGTLGVTGAMSADGGIACDTDKFTVADTSGNTAIAGTLGVTGVATFTAESVHNGGLDTDYVTTDAAAGVDTKTAGTLLLGAATATKVEVGDAGVETEVQGGLDLQQGLLLAYANKTGNYTNATTDLVLSYNTSAVTTNTLPEASTVLGQLFAIALQDDDGDLVVVTDGTDTFDGTNNKITFADAGDSLLVIATGANVYTILVNVGGTLGTL